MTQPRGHYIVDILDKHHVGIALIQVFNEGTMTSWAEKQVAVFVTIEGVVEVDGNGVGRRFLLAHAHLVGHAPHLLVERNLGTQQFLKLGLVLGRHGEMNVDHMIPVGGILCSLLKVFLERCVHSTACTTVKLDQRLRQKAIVEAFLAQHGLRHLSTLSASNECVYVLTIKTLASLVEIAIECKLVDVAEKIFLKVGFRFAVARGHKGKHVFKHAAGSPRCRHKLFDSAIGSLKSLPTLYTLLDILVAKALDAVAHCSHSLDLEIGKSSRKTLELCLERFLTYAFGL